MLERSRIEESFICLLLIRMVGKMEEWHGDGPATQP